MVPDVLINLLDGSRKADEAVSISGAAFFCFFLYMVFFMRFTGDVPLIFFLNCIYILIIIVFVLLRFHDSSHLPFLPFGTLPYHMRGRLKFSLLSSSSSFEDLSF